MSRKDALTLLKGEQTRLFEDEEFALSATGRDLERLIEEEGHAPDWLKLDKAGAIIEEIVASVGKLRNLAARIGEPGGIDKFQAEFTRMETRVTGMAEEYRRLAWLIKRLDAEAVASLQHVP